MVLKTAEKGERRGFSITVPSRDDKPRPERKTHMTIPVIAGTSEKSTRALRKHDVVTKLNFATKNTDSFPDPSTDCMPDSLRGSTMSRAPKENIILGKRAVIWTPASKNTQEQQTSNNVKKSAIAEHT
jgi:hypothetical protein